MRLVFADTSFYVAILNQRDTARDAALEYLRTYAGVMLTTEFVLLELGNFLSRSVRRQRFEAFVHRLRVQPRTQIVALSTDLFNRGLEVFAKRPDKTWSLTDCISFEVMKDGGISGALTTDRHFKQAGFRLLLPSA